MSDERLTGGSQLERDNTRLAIGSGSSSGIIFTCPGDGRHFFVEGGITCQCGARKQTEYANAQLPAVRDVPWYERRHVQLARRCANLRRNIKALQRAHDREVQRARNSVASANRSRDYYVAESNRLREQLAAAKRPRDLTGIAISLSFVCVVMFVAVAVWIFTSPMFRR